MDNPPQASDLSFQVMPTDGIQQPHTPPPPSSPNNNNSSLPEEPEPSSNSKKYIYIAIAAVLVLAIGAAAYFLLGTKKAEPTSKLPKVWMQQFFAKDTCDNQSTCGENADPDSDGLNNYDEFKEGTNPTKSDTDADGLADGDEVNIFQTDPNVMYTDRRPVVAENKWTDSIQIKGGYDPLTGQKFTEARKAQISADTTKFTLHAPSIDSIAPAQTPPPPPADTTLDTSSPAPKSVTVMIQDGKFNPSTITINQGDTVVWLNKDTAKHHVASDPHPAHTDLPGLESTDLTNGKTFSFKFISIGTWGYHDHLNPTVKGTVIVK